ncbi:DUF938 domain-containing protein [Glaciimonas immobilis]|uniref:SAM-dependent methyltransferase n=2 Tax=Glaciimonas immobilis TaxID=728004 RepID=A0A840RR69_9BURK|nr:DUF938 domain-containing protein [Glaciimonas immobilis]KAF3997880.1 DUF938 domain-containing protein [Glaciimonas immobilis]MBB5199476.1 SAM-dependent methyltransferase [Glaciimonas immobilis]
MSKQFSLACERNRHPIAEVLASKLSQARMPSASTVQRVLEIGSGTGQHAVFFAQQFPAAIWQTSDLAANHPSILAWQQEAALSGVLPPLALDMAEPDWSQALTTTYDAVFTANTCHIMSWPQVRNMFLGVGRVLTTGGVFWTYGPFNVDGQFTSPSNAVFDASLKGYAAHMGIRDMAELILLAAESHLVLAADHAMPSNNRLLEWQRV